MKIWKFILVSTDLTSDFTIIEFFKLKTYEMLRVKNSGSLSLFRIIHKTHGIFII